MASPGLITIVDDNTSYRYEGPVRTGTKAKHGHGVITWKGENSGQRYEGGWQDGKKSGQGIQTWPDGHRYDGEYKDDKMSGHGVHTWPDGARYEGEFMFGKRSGRGVLWLLGGRIFDGSWADGRPLRGTAMEPDGALFLAKFNGKAFLDNANWGKEERAPSGRVACGGPPRQGGSGGPPPAWEGQVELLGGAVLSGVFRGLRPDGPGTLSEGGGEARGGEYDGSWTIAEGHVPMEVCRRRRRRAHITANG
jgi:hypothetical protein